MVGRFLLAEFVCWLAKYRLYAFLLRGEALCQRQLDRYRRSFAQGARHGKLAAVQVNDLFANGKTETAA